jgi:hypothetical protein
MHTFRVGDIVSFGRPNGEQTEGKVVRVNTASVTIEQTEARGQTRIREAGAKWRVHPSLVRPINSGSVSVPTAPKTRRNEAEIIAALRNIEMGLSPEHLYCDGERPRSEARSIETRLKAARKALVAELGREPTPNELWSV